VQLRGPEHDKELTSVPALELLPAVKILVKRLHRPFVSLVTNA
jgi:hypothetical protein